MGKGAGSATPMILWYWRDGRSKISRFVETKLEQWMRLELNREKTRTVNFRTRGNELDFLGYTFRFDRDPNGRRPRYLNVVPSKKAVKKERAGCGS